jgi:hypothetical protein
VEVGEEIGVANKVGEGVQEVVFKGGVRAVF